MTYNQIPDTPKLPAVPFPVECRILSISSTQAVGRTFHFLDVPGSSRSPQYIFLIHLQEITIYRNILHIILSSIPNNFQQFYQYLSYWQPTILLFTIPNLSISNLLTLLLPTLGTLPLTKYSKIQPYTFFHTHQQITRFSTQNN